MTTAQQYAVIQGTYTPDETIRPVVQGDWVCSLYDGLNVTIAKVRQSYIGSDGKTYMDLVYYKFNGAKEGRRSPAMGGPKTFEPAIEWDPECWTRIYPPTFPCEPVFAFRDKPGSPGSKVGGFSIFRDEHNARGVSKKPVRTTAVKERPRQISVRVPIAPSNGPEVEAASLRRAAQELRDMARTMPDGSVLKQRATELEAEAARLA